MVCCLVKSKEGKNLIYAGISEYGGSILLFNKIGGRIIELFTAEDGNGLLRIKSKEGKDLIQGCE